MSRNSNVVPNRHVEIKDLKRALTLIVEFKDDEGLVGTLRIEGQKEVVESLDEYRLARDWMRVATARLRTFGLTNLAEMKPSDLIPGKVKRS